MAALTGPSASTETALEAEFDTLASWPALASFVDELSENPQPEEPPYPLDASGLNDMQLHRSLSLPAYLGAGGLGGAGVNLSRSLRATSFGPLLGNQGPQGLDAANAEINARLVSLLSKVRARARVYAAPSPRGRRRDRNQDASHPNQSAARPAHFFCRRAYEPLGLLPLCMCSLNTHN